MVVHGSQYVAGSGTPQPPARRWRFRTSTPLHIRMEQPRMRCTGFAQPRPPGVLEEAAKAELPKFEIPHPPSATHMSTAGSNSARSMYIPCGDEVNPGIKCGEHAPMRPRQGYNYARWNHDGLGQCQHQLRAAETISIPDFGKRPATSRHPTEMETRAAIALTGVNDAPTHGVVDEHIFDLARTIGTPRSPSQQQPQQALHRSRGCGDQQSSVQAPSPHQHVISGAGYRAITLAELAHAIAVETDRAQSHQQQYGPGATGGGKPPFRTSALKSATFDLPFDARDVEYQRDLAADEVHVKRKHVIEEELARRADVSLRRSVVHEKFKEKMKQKFEYSLALRHPHAVRKAQQVISEEWCGQLRQQAAYDGYEVTPKRVEQHQMVASLGSAELSRGLIEELREKYNGFSSTHRQAFREAEATFDPGQPRPTRRFFTSIESRKILSLKKHKSALHLTKSQKPMLAYSQMDDDKLQVQEVRALPDSFEEL